MKELTILIPTANRQECILATLASLIGQTYTHFDIVISDQSQELMVLEDTILGSVVRLLRYRGHDVTVLDNRPFQGMAQQRQFLFEQVKTSYCLYLDDDVLCEPWVIELMIEQIKKARCGFVGMPLIGLSYLKDERPDQQKIEFWEGDIMPEILSPKHEEWLRYKVHNAANMVHVAQKNQITYTNPRLYKVAWIGGCTLYDTAKLGESGAFSFWNRVPQIHCGEDVYAQLQVMRRYGGAGILPSGVHHQELVTTLHDRRFNIPEHLQL